MVIGLATVKLTITLDEDAHVVICARRTGQAVVTSDRADLSRLDPHLPVVVV